MEKIQNEGYAFDCVVTLADGGLVVADLLLFNRKFRARKDLHVPVICLHLKLTFDDHGGKHVEIEVDSYPVEYARRFSKLLIVDEASRSGKTIDAVLSALQGLYKDRGLPAPEMRVAMLGILAGGSPCSNFHELTLQGGQTYPWGPFAEHWTKMHRGLCNENVRIEGRRLTLRGVDPAADGIRGVAADPLVGALLSVLDGVITGGRGIQALNGSYADIDCVTEDNPYPCSLNVTATAAFATNDSTAAMWGAGPFAGQLVAFDRGEIYLFGAQQTATGVGPAGNPRPNIFEYFSTLVVEPHFDAAGVGHQSQLAGSTHINTFSRALLIGGTAVNGSLSCTSAGDAWTDAEVTVSGGALNGCEHVPPPAPAPPLRGTER